MRHDAGRPTTASRVDEAAMIEAIACWCECLQGQAPLRGALQKLAEGLGAEAVALTRVANTPGGESRALIHDSKAPLRDALDRSFAGCVLGRYVGKPKAGTLWLHSMCDTDSDPALTGFQRRRRLSELAVIPLAVEGDSVDFIEMHFAERLAPGAHALLNMMLSTLTRTWARRSPSLFSDVMLRPQTGRAQKPANLPILGINNPAGLSRAEFRICHLLSRGLSTKVVQSELSISDSTLRTHLRNIYAKTGTHSQAELIYQLLSTPALPAAEEHFSGRARVA